MLSSSLPQTLPVSTRALLQPQVLAQVPFHQTAAQTCLLTLQLAETVTRSQLPCLEVVVLPVFQARCEPSVA